MRKGKQRLKPNTVLREYWDNNERFADLFNAQLFGGEQVIKPDELLPVDTMAVSVFEHGEYAESIESARDKINICRHSTALGVELEILGEENQEHIHYGMPMRLMGYDYHVYKKQYDDNAQKYKKCSEGLTRDEFLSKMKKTDKFVPVITIVVYYGSEPWDGARSLHEMLNIPERVRPFVNDYRMLLIEACRCSLPFENPSNIDLFHLLGTIQYDDSRQKEIMTAEIIDYVQEKKVDEDVIKTVSSLTKGKFNMNVKKEEIGGMYTIFDKVADDAAIEGEIKGIIKTGRKYKAGDESIIADIVVECDISEEDARTYMEQYDQTGKITLIEN